MAIHPRHRQAGLGRIALRRGGLVALLSGALACTSSGSGTSSSGGTSGGTAGTAGGQAGAAGGSSGAGTAGTTGSGGAGTAGTAGTTGVAGTAGGGTGVAGTSGGTGVGGAAGTYVWPNATSFTNSDPWIEQHHDQIVQMNPNVLVLNYANKCGANDAVTCDPTEMQKLTQEHIKAFQWASRYHGYNDANAPAFLNYNVVKIVDLRDGTTNVDSAMLPLSSDG